MIRAALLDIEGVLHEGDAPIMGAVEALAALDRRGVPARFLTNTTTRPRRAIAARLQGFGFDVAPARIFTPAAAAARLLEARGARSIHLAADPGLAEDLAGFKIVRTGRADAVVLGDLHRGFDWDRLDGLFRRIQGGAALIALHRNRYCRREGALALDLGPFVAALEYAAGVEAEIAGKPSPALFEAALDDLGVAPGEAVMVGDDLEADIGGARALGIRAVQVRTGKYRPEDEEGDGDAARAPDARIGSVADLPGWIDRAGAADRP